MSEGEFWRLFRVGTGACPTTLFHAHEGHKRLLVENWMHTDGRPVRNPGKKTGAVFPAGFHVCRRQTEAEAYLRRFKDTSMVVVCHVICQCVTPKPGGKQGVMLARNMFIRREDWSDALSQILKGTLQPR